MHAALALILAASLTTDGGAPDSGLTVEALYAKCPDAPLAVEVDGGVFLPHPRAARLNCRLTACENYANEAMAQADEPSLGTMTWVAAVGGAIVLFVGGVYVGWSLGKR